MIETPAVVIGHRHDPIHPAADADMLADELPHGRFLAAESVIEWRARPARLNTEVIGFLAEVFPPADRRTQGSRVRTERARSQVRRPPARPSRVIRARQDTMGTMGS